MYGIVQRGLQQGLMYLSRGRLVRAEAMEVHDLWRFQLFMCWTKYHYQKALLSIINDA